MVVSCSKLNTNQPMSKQSNLPLGFLIQEHNKKELLHSPFMKPNKPSRKRYMLRKMITLTLKKMSPPPTAFFLEISKHTH